MYIEIRKAEFVNKGAELMLHAVLEKMRQGFPEARFVMVPGHNSSAAPYARRAELGLLQKAWFQAFGMQLGNLAALAPGKLRERYGIVLEKEIDIVIDAAGFAYSDQWGVENTRELAISCKRWRKQGKKVILLPQALGPFSTSKIKKYIRMAVDNLDLIFPRDPVSYRHLTEVVGERVNINMAPDFTNLLVGIVPEYFDAGEYRFCLVPNYRMIDKTPEGQSEAYLPFMVKCSKYLIEKNLKPFILVHEGADDLKLAEQISRSTGGKVPVLREKHPLKIKGILGACQGMIGSRYHGLVSALSQGVPALATGWSHKYDMLFQDYGFGEGLMDVNSSDEKIFEKIDLITQPGTRKDILSTIKAGSAKLKTDSEKMWSKVFEVLNTSVPVPKASLQKKTQGL